MAVLYIRDENGKFIPVSTIVGPQGEKGETGAQGPKGDKGSDANVTAENIKNALGYTPVDGRGGTAGQFAVSDGAGGLIWMSKEQEEPAAVLYDREQDLTDAQKSQARENIGAPNVDDVYARYTDHTYQIPGTRDMSSPATTTWCFYFGQNISKVSVKSEFTETGGYFTWKRYESPSVIADGVIPVLVDSGVLNMDELLVLRDVTEYTVVEIKASSGGPKYDTAGNRPFKVYCCTLNNGKLDSVKNLKGFCWSGTYIVSEQIDLVQQEVFEEVASETKKLAAPYRGSTWAVFGDSLTEKNERAAVQYFDYIAADLGIEVTQNYGDSGTGYMNRQDEDLAFYQRILTIAPDTFDFLTIFGSGNDLMHPLGTATDTDTTTIGGCINKTIDNFYSIAPFKKIGIITPTPWSSYEPTQPENKMERISNLLVEICKMRGIPCLDLYHCSGLRPGNEEFRVQFYNENGLQDSGIHPNSAGHKFFAPMVREFIKSLI